jgi:cyclo(L-tyrosyl-L-tyrosyl) synthase
MNTANIPAGNNFPKNTVLNMDNNVIEPIDSIVVYEHICERNTCKQILTLNLVDSTPVHQKGWELIKKRETMVIGVSPGNGYFNKERLEVILMGMANYFEEVVIIVPDLPALHTYKALGYDEHHALERIKKHRQEIGRCHRRVSEQLLLNFGKDNIRFTTWSDSLVEEKCYQQALDQAMEIYRNNCEFSESTLRNTERYILARLEEQDVQQLGGVGKVVEEAAHYLIEEMAFFAMFHMILNKEPVVSYYRDLELASNYVNGKYGNPPNKHIGIATYNIIDSE